MNLPRLLLRVSSVIFAAGMLAAFVWYSQINGQTLVPATVANKKPVMPGSKAALVVVLPDPTWLPKETNDESLHVDHETHTIVLDKDGQGLPPKFFTKFFMGGLFDQWAASKYSGQPNAPALNEVMPRPRWGNPVADRNLGWGTPVPGETQPPLSSDKILFEDLASQPSFSWGAPESLFGLADAPTWAEISGRADSRLQIVVSDSTLSLEEPAKEKVEAEKQMMLMPGSKVGFVFSSLPTQHLSWKQKGRPTFIQEALKYLFSPNPTVTAAKP